MTASVRPQPAGTASGDVQRLLQDLRVDLDVLQFDRIGRELEVISRAAPKRPLVLFFGRPTFSDNTKYLFLEAVRSAPEYEVLWMASTAELAAELTAHKLPCLHFSADIPQALRLMLSAAVAVFCENMNATFGGNNMFSGALAGAHTLQLWHGVSVKQLDLMLVPHLDPLERGFRNAVKLATRTEALLSTSRHLDAFWTEAFGSAQLVRAGQPRNAVVVREPTPHEMIGAALTSAQRAAMQDPRKKKVLVVPTWQRGKPLFVSTPAFHGRIVQWARRNDAVVFVKQHPFRHGAPLPNEVPGTLYFLGAGVDLYPWMAKCDAMITDYSSIMFDFLLTGKPVFTFDAKTETSYGFEPDWSLVPDTPFRYPFDATTMEAVLDANFQSHPLAASQRALCAQLYQTDAASASSELLRLIEAYVADATTRDVHVIDPRTLA